MREETFPPESSIQRLVHDFDNLAGRLHTLMEGHPPYGTPHAALWQTEMEFTTEWQMVAAVDEDSLD